MSSRRRNRKQARAAVAEARTTVSRITGQNVVLSKTAFDALLGHTLTTGDHVLSTHQVGSMSSDQLDLLALELEANASGLSVETGLPGGIVGPIAWVAIAFYTAFLDRRDLADAMLEYGFDTGATQRSDSHMVPTEELTPLTTGPVNAFDPEFRREAPELAALIDQTLAEDGSTPFDYDVVRGVGIADREHRDLSSTRPSSAMQRLSNADMEALAGIALLVAGGEKDEGVLRYLTYLELEMMSALTKQLEKSPAVTTSPPAVSMSVIRGWIDAEMERRPGS